MFKLWCERSISYDVEKEFGKEASFVFKNWKKPSKLTKHSESENHASCMTNLAYGWRAGNLN